MASSTRAESEQRPSGRRSPEEARREILALATEFLHHRPFRDLTVDALMRDATIGRSAFYVYFRDRADLAEALLAELLAELRDATRGWIDDDTMEPWKQLPPGFRALVGVFERHGPLMRAFADAASHDAGFEHLWQEQVMEMFHREVEAQIERQQQAGLVSPQIDARELARALNVMDERYLMDRFGTAGAEADPELVTATIVRVWISTLYPGQLGR